MARKTFKIRSNLTEALDDTVSSAKNNVGELHIEVVPLRKIELDPDNPRDLSLCFKDLDDEPTGNDEAKKRKLAEIKSLSSIAKSIAEQGVINPIVVYKHGSVYRLVAGERRTLGSILAGRVDIPAKILTKKPEPLKLSLLQWIENIEREDLNLWERLNNLEKIASAYMQDNPTNKKETTATELSQLLGCSLQQGVNYRHLLNSSEELRQHIRSGDIKNIEKAALISKSPKALQKTLIQTCVNGNTLSEMKKIAKGIVQPTETVATNTPITKINFGSTQNINVAKIILNSVIKNKELEKYTKGLDISWEDHKSIASAFRQLLKSLEQI